MKEKREHNKILFISHEMSYTGAPRSLLRMCRVAKSLGYVPTVWTMCSGPFEAGCSSVMKAMLLGQADLWNPGSETAIRRRGSSM